MNERPLFFEREDHRLFGVMHIPEEDEVKRAFVFCHPFGEEKLWAHRVYVSFARELASRGFFVLRFDHTGYGDSEGDFSQSTLAVQLQDIDRAVMLVKEYSPSVSEVGFLGLRLGATLALMAADRLGKNGPLILWDPVVDGERFIQEFLRSNLTTQLAVYGEVRVNRDQLVEKLRNGEIVNVDGYDLSYPVYEQIAGIQLLDSDLSAGRPGLIVQIGRTDRPKKEFQEISQLLGADLRCVVEEPFWREIKRFYGKAPNLFDATLEWLENLI